jgi:DNA-binding CsgD family transcriptional regulator
MPESNELSEREKEILRLVATGASNKEIAKRLTISTNTVKVHLRNIFGKIGVASRTEAAMYAVNFGLVQNAIPRSSGTISEPMTIAGGYRRNIPGIRYLWSAGILFGLVIVGIILAWVVIDRNLQNSPNPTAGTILTTSQQPQWKEITSMPTARSGMATTVYENQIYVIAGEGKLGITGTLERYDPQKDIWRELTPKPTPVTDVNAAVIGGKIYIPGGRISSDKTTDILEIYDPRLDAWSVGASLPVNICAYSLVTYEGKIYIFGGWDGTRYRDEVYSYDPERDEWIVKTRMPVALGYSGAVVVNGKIYLMGGVNDQQILDSNYRYSPEQDNGQSPAWQVLSPLPQARSAMGITNVLDRVFIVGGSSKKTQSIPDLEYETLSDTWRQNNETIFENLSNLSLVSLGSQIHALGGRVNNMPVAKQMVYQPFYTILFPIVK